MNTNDQNKSAQANDQNKPAQTQPGMGKQGDQQQKQGSEQQAKPDAGKTPDGANDKPAADGAKS